MWFLLQLPRPRTKCVLSPMVQWFRHKKVSAVLCLEKHSEVIDSLSAHVTHHGLRVWAQGPEEMGAQAWDMLGSAIHSKHQPSILEYNFPASQGQ